MTEKYHGLDMHPNNLSWKRTELSMNKGKMALS